MRHTRNLPPLQLWGGVECTVNRRYDDYSDQMEMSGHASRLDDLDRIADLGIRTLRYPILWERIAPNGLAHADWTWADERLGRLRALGMRPIVGLTHHGSGPRHTSLVDPSFATELAEFAAAVAERYPWVDAYTPVNEPLTTARFSCLYGHWYPHHQDNVAFTQALLNQCRAVILAMEAIRRVNHAAQLVQTEDLGKTYSTPLLAYQAAFENERRWVSLDLLCGRVGPDCSNWRMLIEAGAAEDDLEWFVERGVAPDLLGINHYVTSARFLDERLDAYPTWTHGGNARHTYADVEAFAVRAAGTGEYHELLGEVWERYGLPIAITEAHLGGLREEQARWLYDVWNSAQVARERGCDVRAVTVWSLFGVFDWDSLLTRLVGHYEPGPFDVRAPAPRPTVLAELARDLATGQQPTHPVLATPGWWRRPGRLIYPPVDDVALAQQNAMRIAAKTTRRQTTSPGAHRFGAPNTTQARPLQFVAPARPILICGATGTLGQAFAHICEARGLPYQALPRQSLDVTDERSIADAMERLDPWAVINATGYVRVDDAEQERAECWRLNATGPATLAPVCAARGARLVTFSSDLVFDGQRDTPYSESDTPSPLNMYGRAKAESERAVARAHPAALIIRTSAFFGPWDEYNFVTSMLRDLSEHGACQAANDQVVSPTYLPDLAHVTLDLLVDGESGVWHLANSGALTWEAFGRLVAERAGYDPAQVYGAPGATIGWRTSRPSYSALTSERGWLMRPLEDAVAQYITECSPADARKRA